MADTKEKGFLDMLLDGAEKIVGGAETVLSPQMSGRWKFETVTDAEHGHDVYLVTDGSRSYEARTQEDAEWLVQQLGGE